MRVPGYRLHELHGDLKDFYSVEVSGNWRIPSTNRHRDGRNKEQRITLILLPLVSPIVAGLAFDPVWFTELFIYRGVAPFIVIQLIALVIIYQWQALVTWLPAQAYGIR